jgi:hypothetical protein
MAGVTRFFMAMGSSSLMMTRIMMCVMAGVTRFFMAMIRIWGS